MDSGYEPDGFQWVVESLTAEFEDDLPYEVIVKVVMNTWAGYRQSATNWTRWDVADDAGKRLRRLIADHLDRSARRYFSARA